MASTVLIGEVEAKGRKRLLSRRKQRLRAIRLIQDLIDEAEAVRPRQIDHRQPAATGEHILPAAGVLVLNA